MTEFSFVLTFSEILPNKMAHKVRNFLYIKDLEAGTGIEPVNSGFADRGLTTWLPRRIRLPDLIRWLSTVSILFLVANFPRPGRMSGRQLRVVPYNGNRAYKYYLNGYKVNGKRKRLFFKDESAANRKLTELCEAAKKRGDKTVSIFLST